MKFSFDWLKKHLETNLSLTEVAEKLTSIGLEVESVFDSAAVFKGFKLVQIEKTEKHPQSDHLQLCYTVDAEGNRARIVCGAKNARTGLKTVLATQGAIIPSTNTALKKIKIRGIESEGMMCSAEELAIENPNHIDGIIELPENIDLAASVGDALGFMGGILDVSITPNRGDCFSVHGIARDLAAAGAGKLLTPEWMSSEIDPTGGNFEFPITIENEKTEVYKQYAPIIAFQVIRGIKNSESSDRIKSFLKCAGLNSISAIVDLANLWMFDNGRPLHIYDLNKIHGNLKIRFAETGEKFVDLNGNEHILKHDMLISADDSGPVCLLGIMGGNKIACDENTTDILIESAFFDPVFIAHTGNFLNLISDSRTRFERGINSDSCIAGLGNFSNEVQKICGGNQSKMMVIGTNPEPVSPVVLTKSKLHGICGFEINWDRAKNILEKLGLNEVSTEDRQSSFSIPSWRSDLRLEEDLIEEILRISGYSGVTEIPLNTISIGKDHFLENKLLISSIKKLLASLGLSEIISYSFLKSEHADVFRDSKKLINLLNPISEDMSVMRPSLIPSLLTSAQRSLNRGCEHIELFEAGNVFFGDCREEYNVSGLRVGNAFDRSWISPSRKVDSFDAKRDLFAVLACCCGIEEKSLNIEHHAPTYYHPSRCGTVIQGKKIIGYFGELHPKINKLFGISEKIVCFELLLSYVEAKARKNNYREKIFPGINRDFAFIFNINTSLGNTVAKIQKSDPRIIDVKVFDCFKMDAGKKSVGIAVEMCDPNKTMTEEDAREISDKVIECAESAGGVLRSK